MDGSVGGNLVDRSIGTLVWVRRRNGSWWPGRIIASEELAAAHLLSARSGTPVKLLGREDASVDWYNLEKSKRVKAFRCGEFDACIKKAEASLGAPTRKREKYARKEDAIIDALKLEQQQFGHPQQFEKEPKNLNNINSGACTREFHSFPSDTYVMDDQPIILKKLTNNKSTVLLRNSVLSDDEENNSVSHQSRHREKCSSSVALEEKNDKSFPQMNGLQNFDLSVAPPKKKFKFTDWEAACKPPNNHENVLSCVEPMISDMNHKKRLQSGFNENPPIEIPDKQQTPNQVLLSSAQLPAFSSHKSDLQGERDTKGMVNQATRHIHVYVPGEPTDSEEDSKGSCKEMRGINTHFNGSSELGDETESDSSKAEYLQHGIELDRCITETSQTLCSRSESRKTSISEASESFRCPNNDDAISVPSSSLSSYLQNNMMNSKWNSKGKRNIRNHLGSRHKMNGAVSSHKKPASQSYGNWRYPFPLQGDTDPIRNRHNFIYHDEMDSKLIDVNIQVHQQNHRGEHVPWVSLSSKGNYGKPIVGHPVQVEILEDGSILHLDDGYVLPAYMRTAKRSSAAHRTPRSDQQKFLKGVGLSNQKMKNYPSIKSAQNLETSKGMEVLPAITCVPMKVVFSRILESVRVTS